MAKPQDLLSPNAALERLMEGNDRYVEGKMKRHDFIAERPALALRQNPFAGILGCADSRVGGAHTKRKIKHGKKQNLLADESANLGPQQGDPAQQNSRSTSTSSPIKRAVIEF